VEGPRMQTAYHCSNYYYYYYYYYIEKLTSSYSDTLNAIYKTRIHQRRVGVEKH